MLQEKLYPHWAKLPRKWWNGNGGWNRIVLFWVMVLTMSNLVISVISTDVISWDRLNRDFMPTNEVSRSFLASFILVMDLLIVMQVRTQKAGVYPQWRCVPRGSDALVLICIEILNFDDWCLYILRYNGIVCVLCTDPTKWTNLLSMDYTGCSVISTAEIRKYTCDNNDAQFPLSYQRKCRHN